MYLVHYYVDVIKCRSLKLATITVHQIGVNKCDYLQLNISTVPDSRGVSGERNGRVRVVVSQQNKVPEGIYNLYILGIQNHGI